MARKLQKLINYHTSGTGMPASGDVALGEIVVRHNDDKPELLIRKNNGSFATFIDSGAIETIVTDINGEVNAVIGDVTALKAFSGHVATNFATKTDAQGYANTAKGEAIAAAKTETTNQVGALSGAVVTRFTAVEGDVTALEGFSGHVATNFATKAIASGYAVTAKGEAIATAKTETTNQVKALSGAVETRIAAVEGDVNNLFGDDAGKSVREIAVEELTKQLIASGASESLDELKEIAAWIQQHPKDAAAMNSNIQTISSHTINLISSANSTSTKISAIEGDVTALEGFSGYVATNFATKTDAQGYANTARDNAIVSARTETTNQVKALSGAVVTRFTAVEGDVTALEGFSGHVATNFATKAVASGYAVTAKGEAIDAAKTETTNQVKALSGAVVTRFTAVEGDVTALEGFSGHVATNFATKTDAQGYANTARDNAIVSARTETTNQVGALSGAVVTRFTAVEADVTTIKNNVLYNIDITGISGVTATKDGTTETIDFANMVIDCGDF